MKIEPAARDAQTLAALAALWRESVRATHDFLPHGEAEKLEPLVREGLAAVSRLYVARENGSIAGFLGAERDKIEMLFIAPSRFGRGTGTALLEYAVDALGCRYVDVNEQNERARRFYESRGFAVFGRSALDGQGNPYPILHMALAGKQR